MIAVFAGLGGDEDDGLGEAVLDGRGRLGDHAQPETEALPGRSESQVVDQRRGQRTRGDAVDVKSNSIPASSSAPRTASSARLLDVSPSSRRPCRVL